MNQKTWEFRDFLYADVNGTEIYADLCRIYEGCGAFFYKENKLISSIFCDIDDVYVVSLGEGEEHYCIKTNDHRNTFYLKKYQKEEKEYAKGDRVIPIENDIPWKLTGVFASDDNIEERFGEEIQRNYVWNVLDVQEGCVLLLQKGDVTRFILSKDVTTLENIKENAIHLKSLQEKKNG